MASIATPLIPGTEPATPQTLVGQPTLPPPQSKGDETSRVVMERFRDLIKEIEALASEWPVAANSLMEAKQASARAMVEIVSSQREPESPSPRILG